MKIKSIVLLLIVLLFYGCATVPVREAIPTYRIEGNSYFSLSELCKARGIDWDYDTFTRRISLTKGAQRINLTVGGKLALVNGKAKRLRHPVRLHRGELVIPRRFKEGVLDTLFKSRGKSKTCPAWSRISKVVIDPGHGGRDPGAIGRKGLREKDVNLDIARKLKSLLEAEGIEVLMTRSADTFVSLPRRVAIANDSGADFFLSIHANANRVRSLRGFEVYYVSLRVGDSQRAVSSARKADLDPQIGTIAADSLSLRATLWDMIYTQARRESIELARFVSGSVNRDLGMRVIGIKDANFHVLKGVHMPAVLLEVGFLSNYSEERMLGNSYHRQQIAEAIAGSLKNYDREFTLIQKGI
ncbi:N-acetylmuramoyl-L-alanine amidase [Candidatus Omnitrophota bacterium]